MEPLSPRNPRVQEVRRLARQGRHRADRRAFVVEGPVLVLEAVRAGLIREVYAAAEADAAWLDDLARLDVEVTPAADAAIEAMATTVTPQPVVAVASMPPEAGLADLAADGHVIVLDAVGDPGNAGTIMRSAEASGAAGVVLGPGSVDPFAPKVVRASAGAVFRIPVCRPDDLGEALAELRAAGRRSYGTAADAGSIYDQVDLTTATIVMGSEAHGMGDDVRGEVDDVVRIPQSGAGESLNVAMASTVLGFEAARQRRALHGTGEGAG